MFFVSFTLCNESNTINIGDFIMTEEMNQEIKEEKRCNCICHSEGFKDFLKIALGSFIGVFCALTLFAALHKPPMPPCHCHKMMRPPMHQMHHFNDFQRGDFHKFKMEKRNFDKHIPVKVKVEHDD